MKTLIQHTFMAFCMAFLLSVPVTAQAGKTLDKVKDAAATAVESVESAAGDAVSSVTDEETKTDEEAEEMCDSTFEDDEGDGSIEEEVQIEQMKDETAYKAARHVHSCRPDVVPWPRFNLPANAVGPVECSRKAAKKAVIGQISANCAGANDPGCDGICSRGRECNPKAKRDGARVTFCNRTPNRVPACNNRKGWFCTAQAGRYKCGCSCRM